MINVTIDPTIEGGHGNLVLKLESIKFSQVADTYYFALDSSFMKGDESEQKVIMNLHNLLKCWFAAVQKLESGDVKFLPFDFSDQYIGCLRVEKLEGDNILVDYGSTRKFEGSSFKPSKCEEFVLSDKDYERSTASFICAKSVILSNIRSSMDSI